MDTVHLNTARHFLMKRKMNISSFAEMGEEDKNQDRQTEYIVCHIEETEPEKKRVNMQSHNCVYYVCTVFVVYSS